jgi:outer membrane protein
MRPLIPCFAALAALAASAPAAAAEFRAGYGGWRYDITGTVTDRDRVYDLQQDLALETAGRRSILVEWDTPSGWWPDLAVSFSDLGASGEAAYQTLTFDLLGNPIGTEDQTIHATASFDDYDVTLRYPFAVGAATYTAGVTVKKLRGTVVIDDSGNPPPSRQAYDETVPQVHAGLRWALGKRFAVLATAQGIQAGGNSALEWRAGAEVRLGPLLVEAGWQEKRYDIALDDYALDARLGGALARIGFVFG